MDPPESSVNRIGRTIWTVWGYLSGAVARYLRPEVTAEGNQSVRARTDEIDLKSAVNKIDREVKTNNSDNENDGAEVTCSSSEVRAAASVPWENTGAVKSDNEDKLHVHTTKKTTYNCAAWSTGTETDGEGRTAEKVSSDEVQAEEEHADCESETTRQLQVTEQTDGDNTEECDENHEVEKCAEKREDADNTDVMIQSEPDVELDAQISVTDRGETQDTGGLTHEHPSDETEEHITVQKNQEKTENDKDQGTEPQVQDLLDYFTDEANGISNPERLKTIDKYSEEIDEFSQSGIEEMMPGTGSEQDEESQTAQDLEEIGRFGQKDGDGEERDQDREAEKCDVMREDRSDTDVMIQSQPDVELDAQISVTDRGETQDTGGLTHEHPSDETEKHITVQKNQEKTENDGDLSQVQDLLDYLTDEANSISNPERLKTIDKYSEEIDEFSQSGIEEMMPGTEQDEDTTDREQDMTKYELIESAETLQRESESEKHVPDDETELKMPTVTDETVDTLEDALLSDSEQDTSENTPESGTGSSVLATKTEGMFSDLTVCEFSGESKIHDPQSPAGERAERDSETEHDTLIQTQLSLKEHVELRAELIVETEAFETESRSPVIRNVTLQPHELLEFTGGRYTSSQRAVDTLSETQGNASASDITGTAEHVSEDQTDVKPVSMRSLSPTQLLEEPLHLQADVAKTALEYVEEITNQVLKEMKEAECNSVQKTEPSVGLSTEEAGDAEHQAPAQCVSDAAVPEEERTLLSEALDSSEEHVSSAECENTDGRHEQLQKSIAGESHEDLMEVSRPGMKRGFDQVSTGLPEVKTEGKFNLILQAVEDSSLDFSVQKSRIAVKNPLVRPPKDPRKLLFRASAEPLPRPSDRSRTLQVSAPAKGVIGFKLPGLGAGLPVLRRAEFVQKADAERTLQPQKSEDSVKPEPVPAKPKWTPPKHPGMGSPFMMAELKNKLKKPVQE